MKKINRFAAAALSFALATTFAGCNAPEAITFGNGTKNALTIDGYDVPAGIFINNEIVAYKQAMYNQFLSTGSLPTYDDIKGSKIEDMDAEDWIQNEATETCKLFVAVEREFDKLGEELTDEEKDEIKNYIKSISDNDLFSDNGISEDSIRKTYENTYKQEHIFDHYFGIDGEMGCSEDDLKEYFKDNTARVKYVAIKTTDADGNALEDDAKRELDTKIDKWIREINAEPTNEKKLAKMDDIKTEYDEYTQSLTTTLAGEGDETAVTTTTTAATTTETGSDGSAATTTTTTTDPYANEVTVTKMTTTEPADNKNDTTTTEPAEETDAEKAEKALNEKIFGDMPLYKAEKYEYDKDTVYILIKGDIAERMTDNDLWSEDQVKTVLRNRYADAFSDWIEGIANSYSVEKNDSAYKRYAPFKLDIKDVSLYG
ncbi:MAG: hypothetical protein IJK31_10685 [Ruminococcus sp.]|nr:hypothetical protein [Ruminococcus sp.]